MISFARAGCRLLVIATSLLLMADSTRAAASQIQAVATTTMLADLVQQVGGSRVNAIGLMGPGVDPHLYKPTSADVTRLHNAKVVFYNGLLLEGRMTETFERLAKRGKKVHAIADSVPPDRLLKPPGFEGHADPHIWGDADLWTSCVNKVVAALSDVDPAGAAEYTERGKTYQAELAALHAWAKQTVATIPVEARVLITSHDAFNYFGRAYGFEVVGVQGISTATEAGLADIAKVVDLIRKRTIKAIFVESSVPRATIERISKDSGAKIGGELFSDALGERGKMHTLGGQTYDEGTYTGMLKHNVLTAVESLK